MISDLETVMWFGKYKGKTVGELLNTEPSYLLWAHKKTNIFRLSPELLEEAEQLAWSTPSDDWDYEENEAYNDLLFEDELE